MEDHLPKHPPRTVEHTKIVAAELVRLHKSGKIDLAMLPPLMNLVREHYVVNTKLEFALREAESHTKSQIVLEAKWCTNPKCHSNLNKKENNG